MLLLRALFIIIFFTMLVGASWAGWQCPLFAIPSEVLNHPWFLVTLLDAYWAFVAFYVWVAYKEQSLAARILWFVAIVLWGNLAIALYMLAELSRIQKLDQLGELYASRRPGKLIFPGVLAATGVATYLAAARSFFA